MALKLGSELTPCDQRRAVERWRRTPQFRTDRDWLGSTRFKVNGKGRLDGRARYCYPSPSMQMLMPTRRAAE